jgi:lactate dehydrogenase-like 2-hydroxyacid dehydrogenase
LRVIAAHGAGLDNVDVEETSRRRRGDIGRETADLV